jgi:hypothetical protein
VSSTFSVDPVELSDLASTSAGLANAIAPESLAPQESALAGVSGDADVEGTYGSFISHWKHGLDDIHKNLTDFTGRLSEAAEYYSATENSLVRAASAGAGAAQQMGTVDVAQ